MKKWETPELLELKTEWTHMYPGSDGSDSYFDEQTLEELISKGYKVGSCPTCPC